MSDEKLPDVPVSITVNTGDEEIAIYAMEEFFAEVLSFLGYDERKAAVFTDREYRELTNFEVGTPIRTDDRITLLIVKDIPVASVLYWRNPANYVRVVYAHYLDKKNIDHVRWRDRELD